MVKVSVIIPVYNVENYIARCLDSILCQTFKDFEIICVDDGSTDETLEILNAYCLFDKRIKIIKQQNKGVSAARNTGLKAAKGKYISFVDSDDWIAEDMLEKLYKNAQKHTSDFVFCSINSVDIESGNICAYHSEKVSNIIKKYKNKPFSERDLDANEYFNQHVTVWNKLYRRDFLNKNKLKFYEGLIFEDYLFFTQIYFKAQRISFEEKPLYFYRCNREGSIKKAADERYFDIFKISKEVIKTVEECGEWEKYKMPLLLKNVKDLLTYYFLINPQYREAFFEKIKEQYKGKSFGDYDYDILLENKPFRILMELLGKNYEEFKNLQIDLEDLDE